MKPLHPAPYGASIAVGLILAAGPAWSQFTTLDEYGNAAGTTPPAGFTQAAGTIAITGGGADFWGNSDQGVFLWNNTGSQTTAGDFTATVRHVSTSTPAPEWGRNGIIVRATQTPGTPAANDAHWLVHRKSNGQFVTGRRPTAGAGTFRATDIGNPGVNYDSDANEQSFQTGSVTNTPFFLAAGRQGEKMFSGFALDLGGVAGRWVEHWSTDNPAAVAGLQGGAEVVVGLAHQSHPQTISPDTNDINTATYDNWTYAGNFVASKFGAPASSTTWQVDGSVAVNAGTGAVTGSAFVRESNVATGEAVKWTVSVFDSSSFKPAFGLPGSKKDPTLMEVADLVPAANFRHVDGANNVPGLKADIFLAGNAGNFAALDAIVQGGAPNGSTVLPNIHWGHPDTGVGYPTNGMGGNLFTDAIPEFSDTGDGQEDYGVNMTGQIFIPGDSDRKGISLPPSEFVLFEDGVDDFTYLEIDGVVLINDNDWTGNTSVDNGGGNVSMLDVSNSKFNDGEWVDFRMMMWEGGGGDTCSLYWSAFDTNGSFGIGQVPGSIGNFVLTPGVDNSKKDPQAMEEADLVPAANLRHVDGANDVPGLKAEIYMTGNAGNLGAWEALKANPPDGTTVLPNIHWSNNPNPPYPDNGMGGNLFADAVPDSFTGNQENYGVEMSGEILIPSDANRTALDANNGINYVAFKDGVDDFCYLEIDGQPLINDNDWTGNATSENGGGRISVLDVSAAKYDDGEWVPFRMIMWEGGGGDTASLYWSALDTNGSFPRPTLPGTSAPNFKATGTSQVGSHNTTGNFGSLSLPQGNWIVVLDVANTGTATSKSTVGAVGPSTPAPQITSFSYDPGTTTLNLSFTSEAGASYTLEYTTGFQPAGAPTSAAKWNVVTGYNSIPGVAGTTAIAPLNTTTLVTPGGQLPDNSVSYFRIRKN